MGRDSSLPGKYGHLGGARHRPGVQRTRDGCRMRKHNPQRQLPVRRFRKGCGRALRSAVKRRPHFTDESMPSRRREAKEHSGQTPIFLDQLRKAAQSARCIRQSDCRAWRERSRLIRNAGPPPHPPLTWGRVGWGPALRISAGSEGCYGPTQVGQLAVTGAGAAGTATAGPAGTAGPHGQAGP
jgi:hypothetical protein